MRKLTLGLILILLLGFSCSTPENDTQEITQWAEIYKITLDSYLLQDTALNENINFIAIDFSTLEFANDDDKKEISMWFENKQLTVIDTNFDGLLSEGLFNEEGMYITDGVLLTIINVT